MLLTLAAILAACGLASRHSPMVIFPHHAGCESSRILKLSSAWYVFTQPCGSLSLPAPLSKPRYTFYFYPSIPLFALLFSMIHTRSTATNLRKLSHPRDCGLLPC